MKIREFKFLFAMGFVFSCALGCATEGHMITNSNRSMKEIRSAFVAAAGEARKESENRRTFFSEYFPRNPDPNFKPTKSKERLYGRFTILGDRRPYEVQVEVVIEEKTDEGYEETGIDEDLSHELANQLKKELIKSSEGRNVIDDFRPF